MIQDSVILQLCLNSDSGIKHMKWSGDPLICLKQIHLNGKIKMKQNA